MGKPIIGIDLDITLFDTDEGWREYLVRNSTDFNIAEYRKDVPNDSVEYNLEHYFTLKEGVNGFDYWSDPKTYLDCNIHPNAKRVIQNLYEANCEIVFISYCMGCSDQVKYKIERLKREFDFLLPEDFHFVATKSKGMVNCDILIDDRNEFLNMMREGVKLIKYDSPYIQAEPLLRNHTLCTNWNQIEDVVCNYLEGLITI